MSTLRWSGLQGLSSDVMLVLAGQEAHSHAADSTAHSLLQAEPVDSADQRATGQIGTFEVDASEQGQCPGALDEGTAMGGI